jgi:wyosine [tRNA(Phe)-imidazoG37] synthetase (radical SAM superfamily)
VPTPEEIAEVAVPHINRAEHPVVSFGQGCEGEPLLQTKTIEQAIRIIRQQTDRGTINLNSNASMPDRVARLAHAGLDSMRVSMNSARPEMYERYYRPHSYTFADVLSSIRIMKQAGKFVSLNYFILPGFTDDPEEAAAFFDLVEDYRPDLIQLRNLNMDPDWYLSAMQQTSQKYPLGILRWLSTLKQAFPKLRFGYFNPYLESQCD